MCRSAKRRALVVTGCQRSGKSTLRRLLETHPAIALTEGLCSLRRLGRRPGRYGRCLRCSWRAYPYSGGYDPLWPVRSGLFLLAFRLLVRARARERVGLNDVQASLSRLLGGARIVGDVYGGYLRWLDALVRHPGIEVVVMVRDGRDAVASLARKLREGVRDSTLLTMYPTVEAMAEAWVRANERVEACAQRPSEVRYETLVQDPAGVTNRIAQGLGLESRRIRCAGIETGWVGEHRLGLARSERESVLRIAGPTLERLGYL